MRICCIEYTDAVTATLCPSLTQEAEVLWHLLLTVQISKIFLKYPHPWKTYSEYTLVEAELVSSNLHIDLNHLLVLVILKKAGLHGSSLCWSPHCPGWFCLWSYAVLILTISSWLCTVLENITA